jgi:Tfp pilus assembly protein PilF
VQTALGLDPFYAEAYTVDASIKFYSDRDWDAAEVSYKKAIELDPNNANALIRYSFFLSTLKRYEEALSLAEKAVVIDPISRSSLHGLAWVYLLDGQFMAAEKTFNNALEIHPNWTWGYIKRAYSKLFQGQCESAYEDTEKARSLIGDWGSELLESYFIYIYAKCDFNEEKNEHVDRFLTRVNETNYNNPMAL